LDEIGKLFNVEFFGLSCGDLFEVKRSLGIFAFWRLIEKI
jgi:hypothetical protein